MQNSENKSSRRSFLTGAGAAGATTFTIVRPELVKGFAPAKLKAGLIGCGGRGTQAVVDMMKGDPNVDLVSMGDLFEDKLEGSLRTLKSRQDMAPFQERLKVEPDKRFTGFDSYKKVIASDVDIIMLAAPPGWRPLHLEAAVQAGKHVFCEKPLGTDPVGVRKSMAAARLADEKKLTIVCGAQRRSDPFYLEKIDQIKNGQIGDVVALYVYWVGGPVIQNPNGNTKGWGEMEWQHRNWYSNLWLCGDQVVEQHLHNIDVGCWVMGTHPVKVVASGGAVWRPKNSDIYGNIYDHVSADFEFANGVRMTSYCRQYPRGSYQRVDEIVAGTKGRWGLNQTKGGPGYVNEHTKLMKSIRGEGTRLNEAHALAESTMTCVMARESAYSGLEITWEMIMASRQDLMPKENEWKVDARHDNGPAPVPGIYKFI